MTHQFTKLDVLAQVRPNGGFMNRTVYITDRVIRAHGVWRNNQATSQRVRRLLTNLVSEGKVTRSDDANGFYGHEWTLTDDQG